MKAPKAKAPAKVVKAKKEKKQVKKVKESSSAKWTSMTQKMTFVRVRDPETGRLITQPIF